MAEHKLIDGGEQWLPFARSRLKAMRATGLPYASQQFVMPDGAEVKVRIEGEIDFIRLSGGTGVLPMDAGLIDLKGTADGSPLKYARGKLLDTISTKNYEVGYALPATGTYLTDPTSKPALQLVGRVSFPPFTGNLAPNGRADSFAPRRLAADPPNDPWIDSPNDDALLAKKRMADACPASMFTGRTRLYVQAMYGRPLYGYSSVGAVDPPATWPAGPGLGSTSTPSLQLPLYVRVDDKAVYPPVNIDTSTGVRFDPTTGKHWLIVVNAETLTIYPLVSSVAGEKARKYLRGEPIKPGAAPLTADDVERLEAFILAHCRPDVKNAVTVPAGPASPRVSMGYGWHWNWSGTQADIVTSTTFKQDPVNTGGQFQGRAAMESTHRRITLSLAPDGSWSATKATVEGPTRWAVHRAYWCITEPSWPDMSMFKTTPRDSTLFACNAPFYVFYVRDDLKVCRVVVVEVPAEVNAREMSPGFAASSVYGSYVDEITCGDLDGFLIDRPNRVAFFRASFSCGGLVYDKLDMPWVASGHRYDITKTSFTPGAKGFDNTFAPAFITFTSGYPAPFGTGYVDKTFFHPADDYSIPSLSSPPSITYQNLKEQDSAPVVYFTRRVRDVSESSSSTATIIIPFYDAEAVFMEGTRYVSSVESNITVQTFSSNGYGTQFTRWVAVNQHADATLDFEARESYIKWNAASGGSVITSTTPANTTVENDTVVGKNLVCRAGTVTATMDDLGSFHANDLDAATVGYSAITGARSIGGVAIAPTHITPVGLADPTNVPTSRALVGWV